MTASRLQHIISSSIVLLVSLLVAWISFTQQPAEAFLFPRLISIFFAGFAIWNFIRAISGMARVGDGMDLRVFKNLLPGFLIMLVYVFFAAKALGFYLASSLTFFLVFTLYDPSPFLEPKALVKRAFVTAAFMGIIYCLFALLLKVQTPRGIFI